MAFKHTPQQKVILDYYQQPPHRHPGNRVVVARAGCSKTTISVEGIHLAPENRILACAYNSSSAADLKSKIKRQGVDSLTSHSLGFRLAMRGIPGLTLETDDQKGKRALSLAQRAAPNAPPEMLELIIKLHTKIRELDPLITDYDDPYQAAEDLAYQFDLTPDPDWEALGWTPLRIAERAVMAVEYAAQPTDTMDFSDMLFLPLRHKLYRPIYNMVVLDEMQDLTRPQILLVTKVCRPDGRLIGVGDPMQACYAWRGADSGSMARVKEEWNAQELGLTVTFRCPKKVVAIVNPIVPDFQAAPEAPEGEEITITKERMIELARPGDFIISRVNAPLGKICMALWKQGTRARVKGREIGTSLLARLRGLKCDNLKDLGGKANEWRAIERERMSALTEEAIKAKMEIIDDQVELFTSLSEGLSTMDELVSRIKDLFVENPDKGAVACMSGHRSKGLEAERIFVLKGTFRVGGEEDNLRYIASTRSKYTHFWVTGFEKSIDVAPKVTT